MTEKILHEMTDDGIAVMTLNRAPVNALNPEFLSDIEVHLQRLESDSAVRAVVISSACKVFCAGLDLKEVVEYSVSQQTAIVDGLNSAFSRLYGFPKPVIAATTGAAIAGGLFFVLSADYAVVRAGARLGLSEVRVGANFPVGPLEIARDSLSKGAFRRILLSGLPVVAAEAFRMGFVDEVCPADQVMERAMTVARDYASFPAQTYGARKSQMRASALSVINEILKKNADPTRDGWFTSETVSAMKSALSPSKS